MGSMSWTRLLSCRGGGRNQEKRRSAAKHKNGPKEFSTGETVGTQNQARFSFRLVAASGVAGTKANQPSCGTLGENQQHCYCQDEQHSKARSLHEILL